MTDEIKILVDADGTTEAEAGIKKVSTALDGLETNEREAAAAADALANKQRAAAAAANELAIKQTAAATKAIDFTSKIAGAAGAIQGMTSALGVQGGTAGLIASIAGSTAAGAQMGAMFGPQGAVVGGILGALIPALTSLVTRTDDATTATNKLKEAEEALATARTRRTAERQAQVAREIESGRLVSITQEEIADAVLLSEQALADATARRDRVNNLGQQARRAPEGSRMREELLSRARTELADIEASEQLLTNRIRTLEARSGELQREERRPEASSLSDLGRGTAARTSPRAAEVRTWEDAELEAQEAVEAAKERHRAADEVRHTAEMEERQAKFDATREQIELDEAAALAAKELANTAAEKARAASEAVIEAGKAQTEVVMGQIQSVANGIGNAIVKVAESNATAEESAKIALATTLELIGETAGMLAGMEFAKAASSYPDVAGMAIHAAAGVAFTAVAIATGAGAGALNKDVANSQAARAEKEKPEKPENSSGGASGSGGNVIINWNSPIVMGLTQAEVGQNLVNSIRVAQRRGMAA